MKPWKPVGEALRRDGEIPIFFSSVDEKNVDSTAAIHEDFGQAETADDQVEHQGEFSWVRDVVWVIRSVKGDGGVRPI